MEDCFFVFCCSDQQFRSSALTQQFNSLTRLFSCEYFLTTFNALISSSIFISSSSLLVSASKTDGLSDVHRRLIQRVLFTEKMWNQEKARAKRKNGLSDARAKHTTTVVETSNWRLILLCGFSDLVRGSSQKMRIRRRLPLIDLN